MPLAGQCASTLASLLWCVIHPLRCRFSGSSHCFSNRWLLGQLFSSLHPKMQNADNRQVHCCISLRAAIYDKHSACIEALPPPCSSQVCMLCQVAVSGRERSGWGLGGMGGSKLFFFFDHLNAKSVCLLCGELGSLPQCKLALYLTLGGI